MKTKQKIILAACLLIIQSAMADTTTTNFQTSATLNSTCVVSSTDINFGSIALTSVSNVISSTGTLSFLCSNNTSVTIALSNGNSPTVTAGNTRYMVGSSGNTDKLYYGIFRPVGFGPGVQGPGQWSNVAGTPQNYVVTTSTGTLQTLPMLARLDTNQIAMPDNYHDSITVSFTY